MNAERQSTRQDHARRIDRVLIYLAANLDQNTDLIALAKIACLSPYHFHRIYRAVQAETVADTLRRMRLHRAALEVLEKAIPMERIALRAGYASQAAFTRAFRNSYDAPPSAYRRRAIEAAAGPYPLERRSSAAIEVVSLAHRGDYDSIGASFDRLFAFASLRGIDGPETRSFGIYYDDPLSTAVTELRSDACLTLAVEFEEEGEFSRRRIAGGEYAVLRHLGPYAELHNAYDWLYGTWLESSGETIANEPCVEAYLNHPRSTLAAELVTEIWLPLLAAETAQTR